MTSTARDELIVADRDRPLAGDPRATAHDLDATVGEPGELGAVVEVVDDLVAAAQDGPNVELAADRLGCPWDPARLVDGLGGAQQRLRRHAGIERALAADEMRLDDRDAQACLPEPAGAHLAGGTRADHDDVELVRAHLVSLRSLATCTTESGLFSAVASGRGSDARSRSGPASRSASG